MSQEASRMSTWKVTPGIEGSHACFDWLLVGSSGKETGPPAGVAAAPGAGPPVLPLQKKLPMLALARALVNKLDSEVHIHTAASGLGFIHAHNGHLVIIPEDAELKQVSSGTEAMVQTVSAVELSD
ncbi:hypothetical protein H920_01397 [Fukomys damarensis]|uniref:Uncharacterized protein n=1 Tax=Fukomys damarensis TaxID=885580 RepID=A0A091E3T8_FUKDA|nr:hypothetical protein H920_01397 [Fukomys damarensis]